VQQAKLLRAGIEVGRGWRRLARRDLRDLDAAAQQPLDGAGLPTDTAFLHGDLIGTTNLTTDAAGGPLQAAAVAYTAFGEPVGDPSTLDTRSQYAGAWGYESDLLSLAGVNPNLPAITLQHSAPAGTSRTSVGSCSAIRSGSGAS
jgi:hypothetical protein